MRTAVGATGKALESYPVGSFVHTNRLPGTAAAVASVIKRANDRGDLIRIHNGLYYKGAKTRYGMTRPSTDQIAIEVLGKSGVGPTGFSAARAFGLTTQVPAKPALVVTGTRVPTTVPAGVMVSSRANPARVTLRRLEIAALELLRGDWETTVDDGWFALSEAIAKAVKAGKLRWSKLTAAAAGERSPALRKNLERLTMDLNASGILA